MNHSALISRLKDLRKQHYLDLNHKYKYAVVGIGSHSMINIYPILQYHRLPVKYIVVKSDKNANKITRNFEGVTGTTDLDKVLADPEIKGVFVSANPKIHFDIVSKLLNGGKEVFVEKPPCSTSGELRSLIETSQSSGCSCFVGLQKRYSPANVLLKKKLKKVRSYSYRFMTGAFPEGDPVLELFIHPVDLCTWLFGEAEVKSKMNRTTKSGRTDFLHLAHKDGTFGSLELSTHGNWDSCVEQIEVNTVDGIYKMRDSVELTFQPLWQTFLGIPLEKAVQKKPAEVFLVKRDSFNSTLNSNHLYQAGYFSLLSAFINWCESNKGGNGSGPSTLINTYKILETIN